MKKSLVTHTLARAAMACLIACGGLALSACGSNPDKDRPENPFKKAPKPGDAKAPESDAELHAKADRLYRDAHAAVIASDWTPAGERLKKLIAAYPFSDYATQAEMELIFVGYKGGQPDEALGNADRFLRAHPRTLQAEYVQYLRGVINFSRTESFLDAVGINESPRKDVSSERASYADFALLVQRYPKSRYAGDAIRRMAYLRNRIAAHELTVAQYYLRRGAFIAAARRAQSVITDYPGAPATLQALAILESSYRQAGLQEQADDAATLIAANINNKPEVAPRKIGLPLDAVTAPSAYSTANPNAPSLVPAAAPAGSATTDVKPSFGQRFKHFFGSSKPDSQPAANPPSAPAVSSSSVPTTPAASAAAAASSPATPATAPASGGANDTSTSTTPTPHGVDFSIGPPGEKTQNSTPDAKPAAPNNP